MATTCTNCGCSKPKCGCQDTMLTTPPPCPTPIGCPDPEPCAEIFDAQCVIFTAPDVFCDTELVVSQDSNIQEAITDVVDFFCGQFTITKDIICNNTTISTEGTLLSSALEQVSAYFCSNVIVSADIECDTTTVVAQGTSVVNALQDIVDYFCSVVPQPPLITVVDGDITTNVTSATVGNTTTYTVSIEDTGWVDLEGFAYYQGSMATQKPQCRRIGKQIHFRGNLYVPITDGAAIIPITAADTYRTVNRKTPAITAGGVYVDANSYMYFNSTGAAGNSVIPTSVLPALTTLDNSYKLDREFASRQFRVYNVVNAVGPIQPEEGTVLFNAPIEVSILANKQLRITPLETLERNINDEISFSGSGLLRNLTSSYTGRSFIKNFSTPMFSQDGTHSNAEALKTLGVLVVGRAYFIADYAAGDDFTNVGAVVNSSSQFFVATGTTPTTWTGSEVYEIAGGIDGFGYFYPGISPTQRASRFELLDDGSSLDAALANDLGGFMISLDGLVAFIA